MARIWRDGDGQPIVVVSPDVLQVCIVWTKLSWVRLAKNNSLIFFFIGRFLSYDLQLKRTLQSSAVHADATGKKSSPSCSGIYFSCETLMRTNFGMCVRLVENSLE